MKAHHLNNSIEVAIAADNLDKIKKIVTNGLSQSLLDKALWIACQEGKIDMVKYLVENGAEAKSQDCLPLFMAIACGHLDIVKYLIEKANPIEDCHFFYTSMKNAFENNHIEVVEYLMDRGYSFKDWFLTEDNKDRIMKSEKAQDFLHRILEKEHWEYSKFKNHLNDKTKGKHEELDGADEYNLT